MARDILCRRTKNKSVVELLQATFCPSARDYGSLYELVEYLDKNRTIHFVPTETGTFCKWCYGELSDETDTWLHSHGETYEFHTGTDGDYRESFPPEFAAVLESLKADGLDDQLAAAIQYEIGGIIANKKRAEFLGAIDKFDSISMAGLSFDPFAHPIRGRRFIVQCALHAMHEGLGQPPIVP